MEYQINMEDKLRVVQDAMLHEWGESVENRESIAMLEESMLKIIKTSNRGEQLIEVEHPDGMFWVLDSLADPILYRDLEDAEEEWG